MSYDGRGNGGKQAKDYGCGQADAELCAHTCLVGASRRGIEFLQRSPVFNCPPLPSWGGRCGGVPVKTATIKKTADLRGG